MNICREDAEHFQLRVSTEEQLLLTQHRDRNASRTGQHYLDPDAGGLGDGWSDAIRSICEKPGGEAMITFASCITQC
jgi:hypothetical protein